MLPNIFPTSLPNKQLVKRSDKKNKGNTHYFKYYSKHWANKGRVLNVKETMIWAIPYSMCHVKNMLIKHMKVV